MLWRHPYKEAVEDRVVEGSVCNGIQMAGCKERNLNVAQNYKHKPTECYCRVHIAKQRFTFPYLGV